MYICREYFKIKVYSNPFPLILKPPPNIKTPGPRDFAVSGPTFNLKGATLGGA